MMFPLAIKTWNSERVGSGSDPPWMALTLVMTHVTDTLRRHNEWIKQIEVMKLGKYEVFTKVRQKWAPVGIGVA